MTNTHAPNAQISRSFVWWWVLANMVGLTVVLVPFGIGYFLILGIAIMADGASVGYVLYIFAAIILALSEAIIGGWLGLMQWLVLRKQVLQAHKWISASSIGVAVGAILGWLANSRHPRILHSFDHAGNLINECREVLSIVT